MSKSLPQSLAGFTVIPVQYSSTSTHVIYARAHVSSKKGKAKDLGLPEGRTLFLVNVPPDASEREITSLFKHCGTIEKVVFEGDEEESNGQDEVDGFEDSEDEVVGDAEEAGDDEQPRKKRKFAKNAQQPIPHVIPLPTRTSRTLRRTGRTAQVVFLDESSLARALVAPTKTRPWPQDDAAPSGLAHYIALYSALRPPLDVVKAHADSWMERFEFDQAKKKQQSKYRKGEAIVDDDGFTLVTRGGAYGQTVGGGVGVASKKFQRERAGGSKRNRKVHKEPKEKEAFYSFQVHEKKRKGAFFFDLSSYNIVDSPICSELLDLRRKWEEDKVKVEKLKESRKFKPY